MIHISAGEFKAKCLKLMDLAALKHETIVITKRGTPVAKLMPYTENVSHLFGFLKESVVIKSNITEPMEDAWYAEKT